MKERRGPLLLKAKFPRKKREGMVAIVKTVPVIDRPGVKRELNTARLNDTLRELGERRKSRAALEEMEKARKKGEYDSQKKLIKGMVRITDINVPYSRALRAAQNAGVKQERVGMDYYVMPEDIKKIRRFDQKAQAAAKEPRKIQRKPQGKKKGVMVKKPIEKKEPLEVPQSIRGINDKMEFVKLMAERMKKIPEERRNEWRGLALEGLMDRGMSDDGARFMTWRHLKE